MAITHLLTGRLDGGGMEKFNRPWNKAKKQAVKMF